MTTSSVATSRTRPVGAGTLLLLFAALTVAVHFRLLAETDLRFARALQPLNIAGVHELATLTGVALAGQTTLIYGLIAALLLWRAGLGIWSAAPLTFVVATLVEIVMKNAVNQPAEPLIEFHRSTYYPFTTVSLEGAFPSGHASRTAFCLVFLAVLLWSRGTGRSRVAAIVALLFIPLVAFTRLYIGDHWLSDVVAGVLLGAALALLAAPPVASRLRR